MNPHDPLDQVVALMRTSGEWHWTSTADDIEYALRQGRSITSEMHEVEDFMIQLLERDLQPGVSVAQLPGIGSWQLYQALRAQGYLASMDRDMKATLSAIRVYQYLFDVQAHIWSEHVEAGGGFKIRVAANDEDEAVDMAEQLVGLYAEDQARRIGLPIPIGWGVADAELFGVHTGTEALPYAHSAAREA